MSNTNASKNSAAAPSARHVIAAIADLAGVKATDALVVSGAVFAEITVWYRDPTAGGEMVQETLPLGTDTALVISLAGPGLVVEGVGLIEVDV